MFLPSHRSRVLGGDGLVGGNPTMDAPRLRRGGGITSSSFFFFYLYWYSYIIRSSIFCCDSFRVWSGGLYFLLGVFLPLPASCFSELVIFRNLHHIFLACVETFSGSLLFYFIFLSLKADSYRPCLNVEIESVHRICLLTDSVDRSCLGPNDHLGNTVSLDSHASESFPTPTHW